MRCVVVFRSNVGERHSRIVRPTSYFSPHKPSFIVVLLGSVDSVAENRHSAILPCYS